MGFFGKLIGDALGQVVSDTVGKVVKEAIAGDNTSNANQNNANQNNVNQNNVNQNNVVGGQTNPQTSGGGMVDFLSRLQNAVNEVEKLGNSEGVMSCLARWDTILPQYPKWDLPAKSMSIERLGDGEGGYFYSLDVEVEHEIEMEQFRNIYCDRLRNAGYTKAGKYPDENHYYKRIMGVVYHVDLEHWYENDCVLNILYRKGEPEGGYDYNPTGEPTIGDVIDTISGNQSRSQSGKSFFDMLKDSL